MPSRCTQTQPTIANNVQRTKQSMQHRFSLTSRFTNQMDDDDDDNTTIKTHTLKHTHRLTPIATIKTKKLFLSPIIIDIDNTLQHVHEQQLLHTSTLPHVFTATRIHNHTPPFPHDRQLLTLSPPLMHSIEKSPHYYFSFFLHTSLCCAQSLAWHARPQ
jgi:hypothetical protein